MNTSKFQSQGSSDYNLCLGYVGTNYLQSGKFVATRQEKWVITGDNCTASIYI